MKTILITGANRGLGLELVKQSLNDNWQVLAVCRNPEQAKELNQIKQTHEHLTIYQCDVNSETDLTKLASQLNGIAIDILYNNAGIYGPSNTTLQNISTEDWLKVFATNTISPLRVTNALLANLQMGHAKIIVNVSSLMGSISDNKAGGSYSYRSSKAALNAVTKSLSIDLQKDKITVIAMHPGWVQTDMGGDNAPMKPEESVAGIKKILNKLSLSDSGCFFNFDGSLLHW